MCARALREVRSTLREVATEIDTFCRLDNHDALPKLWVTLSGYVEEAKDVYERRYQVMLADRGNRLGCLAPRKRIDGEAPIKD